MASRLGALTLLVINNGLTLVRVDPLWLQGVYGLVILAAIGIDAYVARRTAGGPKGDAHEPTNTKRSHRISLPVSAIGTISSPH